MIAQAVDLAQAATGGEQISLGETIAFWILAPLALAGGLGMVFARNAVHSALWLALCMLSLGVIYLVQQAPFLGIVQIIVYTGAIMMLFLFVLMMVGRDATDSVVEVLRGQRLAAAALGIGLAGLLVGSLARAFTSVTSVGLADQNQGTGNVAGVGRKIFTEYLFPFELTSALLMTAAVGAIVLTMLGRNRQKSSQRELVEARFRGEYERPTPLPGPGVFATSNSVSTPALLPDGTAAPESLSEIIDSVARDRIEADRRAVAAGDTPDAHALKGSS